MNRAQAKKAELLKRVQQSSIGYSSSQLKCIRDPIQQTKQAKKTTKDGSPIRPTEDATSSFSTEQIQQENLPECSNAGSSKKQKKMQKVLPSQHIRKNESNKNASEIVVNTLQSSKRLRGRPMPRRDLSLNEVDVIDEVDASNVIDASDQTKSQPKPRKTAEKNAPKPLSKSMKPEPPSKLIRTILKPLSKYPSNKKIGSSERFQMKIAELLKRAQESNKPQNWSQFDTDTTVDPLSKQSKTTSPKKHSQRDVPLTKLPRAADMLSKLNKAMKSLSNLQQKTEASPPNHLETLQQRLPPKAVITKTPHYCLGVNASQLVKRTGETIEGVSPRNNQMNAIQQPNTVQPLKTPQQENAVVPLSSKPHHPSSKAPNIVHSSTQTAQIDKKHR